MQHIIGTYTVTGDDNSLEGWTVGSLATALETVLSPIGIEIETRPNQVGGGGLTLRGSDLEGYPEAMIEDLIERVIVDGPEGQEGRVQEVKDTIREALTRTLIEELRDEWEVPEKKLEELIREDALRCGLCGAVLEAEEIGDRLYLRCPHADESDEDHTDFGVLDL